MIGEIITRTGGNVLKVGTILIISTLTSAALKDASNRTMTEMARDIRRVKTDYADRKRLNAGA